MYTPETLRRLSDEIESIPAQNDYGTLDEANKARAHAAAWQARDTELIEALNRVVSYADAHWTHNNKGAWRVIDAARAAIKKAE